MNEILRWIDNDNLEEIKNLLIYSPEKVNEIFDRNHMQINIFIYSIGKNKNNIFDFLLENGADINYQHNSSSLSPILAAVSANNSYALNKLLDKNVDVNVKINDIHLIFCCVFWSLDCTKILIERYPEMIYLRSDTLYRITPYIFVLRLSERNPHNKLYRDIVDFFKNNQKTCNIVSNMS